ncbi:MAG: hypothetical protein ACRD0Z_06315 [Acidimicrobiales bacterium]
MPEQATRNRRRRHLWREKSRLAVTAVGVAAACCLSACSSSGPQAAPTRSLGRDKVYSAFGLSVDADFPGEAKVVGNPAAFRGLFSGHSAATSWSIGNLGLLHVDSYDLVMVQFPATTPAAEMTNELKGYAGELNTRLYGRPGLKEVSPTTNGRFGGTLAFSDGDVLVIAGAYDVVKAPISRFIDSIKLAAG